jgi:hypothetical protein
VPDENVGSVNWLALLDEALIFGVCSNPKPNKVIAALGRQRPNPRVDASRPKFADLFEMKRRVGRIRLQKRKLAIGLLAYLHGQRLITRPVP